MVELQKKYESQNSLQDSAENDTFTLERYEQFFKFLPKNRIDKTVVKVLDVGCSTGKGGLHLKKLNHSLEIFGLDCVETRLNSLPECYSNKVYGLSTNIPTEDLFFDVIVAGEFLEHLYPADVDKTLCEFQRVLKIGGRLLLTTPNPNYLKNKLGKTSVYGTSHLTQHFPKVLKNRLLMHGFSKVRILGSGKVSRYLGYKFPILAMYGSYLVMGKKY